MFFFQFSKQREIVLGIQKKLDIDISLLCFIECNLTQILEQREIAIVT